MAGYRRLLTRGEARLHGARGRPPPPSPAPRPPPGRSGCGRAPGAGPGRPGCAGPGPKRRPARHRKGPALRPVHRPPLAASPPARPAVTSSPTIKGHVEVGRRVPADRADLPALARRAQQAGQVDQEHRHPALQLVALDHVGATSPTTPIDLPPAPTRRPGGRGAATRPRPAHRRRPHRGHVRAGKGTTAGPATLVPSASTCQARTA